MAISCKGAVQKKTKWNKSLSVSVKERTGYENELKFQKEDINTFSGKLSIDEDNKPIKDLI